MALEPVAHREVRRLRRKHAPPLVDAHCRAQLGEAHVVGQQADARQVAPEADREPEREQHSGRTLAACVLKFELID